MNKANTQIDPIAVLPWQRVLRVSTALCIAASALLAQPAGPAVARTQPAPAVAPTVGAPILGAPASQIQLPAACTTKTRLQNTPIDRAWVFIMNFRVERTACLLVYDRTKRELVDGELTPPLIGWRTFPNACTRNGDVAFVDGRAIFRDGYIECDLNVMNAVNSIVTETAHITATAWITSFYILGRGVISPVVTPITDTGVILAYDPKLITAPVTSLNVVVTSTQPNVAVLASKFNGVFHLHPGCAFPFGLTDQMWAFTRGEEGLKYWLQAGQVCDTVPRLPVAFWQNGGTFYIGGTPAGNRFKGILDEVILDPVGGSRPPSSMDDDNTEYSYVLLPLVMRD